MMAAHSNFFEHKSSFPKAEVTDGRGLSEVEAIDALRPRQISFFAGQVLILCFGIVSSIC